MSQGEFWTTLNTKHRTHRVWGGDWWEVGEELGMKNANEGRRWRHSQKFLIVDWWCLWRWTFVDLNFLCFWKSFIRATNGHLDVNTHKTFSVKRFRTPIDRTTPTQYHRKLLYQVRDKCDRFPSNGSDFRHDVYVLVKWTLLSEKEFFVLILGTKKLFIFQVFTDLCH